MAAKGQALYLPKNNGKDNIYIKFVYMVLELRREQKKLLETKNQEHLVNCKKLEKQVDDCIKHLTLNGAPESAALAQKKLEL